MAERIYVKGHKGILYVKDSKSYKPLVCLISTSIDRSANTSETVSYTHLDVYKRQESYTGYLQY